jgi:D-tyrosyl-tRNA(Tyr) deacylase
MKIVAQRVKSAAVSFDGIRREISHGLVLLIGIHELDNDQIISKLVDKCLNLRIFEDEDGKMNRSLLDVNGHILAISQFTLYGNTKKGRRPSFVDAAPPEIAERVYDQFVFELKKSNLPVETGKFGADMLVEINNDGPVTLILENE